VGVEAGTGRLLWRYGPPANRTANAATPVFQDNRVFYSSAYGNGGGLLELAPVGDRVLTRQVYFVKHMQNHFGNIVLLDGAMYGASGNILTCIDFLTGKILWQDRGIGKVSVNYADGCLYMVSERGSVGLARATRDGYQQLGTFDLISPQGPTRTGPIVSDGRMFVRNVERLLCYDVRAE
jgi:outer membrane protein assembly factor BamB